MISNVVVDGSSVGAVSSYTFSNVRSPHDQRNLLSPDLHTNRISRNWWHNLPIGSVTVNHGANQTFTITPNTGYSIANVRVDGSSQGAISSYTFNNVTANHTISATFTANSIYYQRISRDRWYNFTLRSNVTVSHGSNQTFTITPTSGYAISNVLVDGVSQGAVGSYTFGNVTANHTISARFSQITYTINASACCWRHNITLWFGYSGARSKSDLYDHTRFWVHNS